MLVRSCSQALDHERSISSSPKLPLIYATKFAYGARVLFSLYWSLVTHLSRRCFVFVMKNSLSGRFRCATETLSIPCTTATPSSGTPRRRLGGAWRSEGHRPHADRDRRAVGHRAMSPIPARHQH